MEGLSRKGTVLAMGGCRVDRAAFPGQEAPVGTGCHRSWGRPARRQEPKAKFFCRSWHSWQESA